ncbi:hypothetical protein NL676_004576 [Syzygium grande]|nr:hypothetical protein NL676_004576 [Syzygium grande]
MFPRGASSQNFSTGSRQPGPMGQDHGDSGEIEGRKCLRFRARSSGLLSIERRRERDWAKQASTKQERLTRRGLGTVTVSVKGRLLGQQCACHDSRRGGGGDDFQRGGNNSFETRGPEKGGIYLDRKI